METTTMNLPAVYESSLGWLWLITDKELALVDQFGVSNFKSDNYAFFDEHVKEIVEECRRTDNFDKFFKEFQNKSTEMHKVAHVAFIKSKYKAA
jgi:hypothetical protein